MRSVGSGFLSGALRTLRSWLGIEDKRRNVSHKRWRLKLVVHKSLSCTSTRL
jgi:hypothetical protein